MVRAAYPSKTLFIVVPFGRGNADDQTVRCLAERLQDATDPPSVVDSRLPASSRSESLASRVASRCRCGEAG